MRFVFNGWNAKLNQLQKVFYQGETQNENSA